MSKIIKVFSLLIMVAIIVMSTTPVFADVSFDDAIKKVNITNPKATSDAMPTVNKILGFLQWGSIIGGIIIITVLGIKYMMGSLEEKSEYKKSMIPLVIGIIVVVSATTIAKILFNTFAS